MNRDYATPLENQVLNLRAQNIPQKEIANILGITEWRVRCIVKAYITDLANAPRKIKLGTEYLPLNKVTKSTKEKVKKAIVISDIHVPSHCSKALAIAIERGKDIKIDKLVLAGDIIDNYNVSNYTKDPTLVENFQDEILQTRSLLKFLRKSFPKAEIDYLEGNHECFSDDTEVLTERGWVLFKDLTDQDKVASYDKKADEITFDLPIARQDYDHNGKVYSIKGTTTSLLITGNHRLLYKKTLKNSPWNLTKIDNIPKIKNRLLFKTAVFSKNAEFTISDKQLNLASMLYKMSSLEDGVFTFTAEKDVLDNFLVTLEENNINHDLKEKPIDLNDYIGKFISEPIKQSFIVSFNASELKGTPLENLDPNSPPTWLNKLSQRQFDMFVLALAVKQYNNSGTEKGIAVVNERAFLDALQIASIFHGYDAYLNKDGSLGLVSRDYVMLDKFGDKVKEQIYEGKVYCVTTKNDTVVVRREGKVSITGNSRLRRQLVEKLPQLSLLDAIDIPSLLKLEEFGIKWHQENQPVCLGALEVIHGDMVRSGSGASAKAHHMKMGGSVLHGHVHRLGAFYKTNRFGVHVGIENGHLSTGEVDYTSRPDWQQGFTEVTYIDDGRFSFRQHNIVDGTLLVDGIFYSA